MQLKVIEDESLDKTNLCDLKQLRYISLKYHEAEHWFGLKLASDIPGSPCSSSNWKSFAWIKDHLKYIIMPIDLLI